MSDEILKEICRCKSDSFVQFLERYCYISDLIVLRSTKHFHSISPSEQKWTLQELELSRAFSGP